MLNYKLEVVRLLKGNHMNNEIKQLENKIEALEKLIAAKNEKIYEIENILDNVPVHVYWKDKNGVFLGCNTQVLDFLKLTDRNKVIGQSDYNDRQLHVKNTQNVSQIISNDQKVLKLGKTVEAEEIFSTDEDKKIYLNVKTPLKKMSGEIYGVMGVAIDITDRKKLEEETKQQKIELEQKDQLKKEFIKHFSHDVKLPINGIVGNTQLLQMLTKGDPKLQQTAISIDNGVMSLNTMFDYLYNTMVNDEFGNDIHNKDFNFADMIDLEMALVKSSITINQDINVSVELDDKIPEQLHGDSFKVSQILRNILSNSVRYTKTGEIKLIAKVLEDTSDKIKIKFTISDTGSGMTTTDKNKVYEYGRRFVSSYETNIPGTGIGLSIVKKHVDTLGGTIDFDSEIGEGTQFFVELTFNKV